MAQVVIMMGSKSDEEKVSPCVDVLRSLGISYLFTVSSAHRTPERTEKILREQEAAGAKVFICAAGMAAHGRNDIRLCALCLYEGGQFPQHHRHIVDLTAAAGQHHLHARLDTGPDVLRHQPLPQIRGNILNGVVRKMLLDDRHLRQHHRRQHLP